MNKYVYVDNLSLDTLISNVSKISGESIER